MQVVRLALFIFIQDGLFLVSLVNHMGFVSMRENVGMLCARSRSDIPFVSQDFPAGQKRLKSVNFVTLTCVGDHGDSTQEIWTGENMADFIYLYNAGCSSEEA